MLLKSEGALGVPESAFSIFLLPGFGIVGFRVAVLGFRVSNFGLRV